jgi:2,4-dienoyl-CoA reductase-like NADH-dependent reductase (Old Yellow Enzyme family)
VTDNGAVVVSAMTAQDIADVAASFARAAADAERTGFDGVEVHGAHGYLIDQFLWAQTNTRQDEYGGSVSNRARFAIEVVKAIRNAVSADFPVVFRFSQWKSADYAARIAETPDDLAAIVEPLARAGVDCFHVSTRRFWEPAFAGSDVPLAELTRQITGKPVIAVGSVGLDQPHQSRAFRDTVDIGAQVDDLDRLIRMMERDAFDLVAIGRAILSDPDWPHKVQRGEIDRIRPFSRENIETYM